MYTCTEIDTSNNCLSWVQTSIFGLPDLSISDAQMICGAIGLLFAVAWGCRELVRAI